MTNEEERIDKDNELSNSHRTRMKNPLNTYLMKLFPLR